MSPLTQPPPPAPEGGGGASPEQPVLMAGMGWFPDTLGGLFEALPEARGVVVGPAADAPAALTAVASPAAALPRRLLAYSRALRASLDESELIDLHFALYALLPQLAGTMRGHPRVFHFHGPWAQENLAAGDRSRVRRALRHRLERHVMRRAQAHVVLSSAFKRVLVEGYRISPWEVHAWRPGVDLSSYTPGEREPARAALGIEQGAFVAVCVRRLVARMGLDALVDAWELALPSLGAGARLLVVGDGPLREYLQARAAAAPAGSVRVLGRLAETELVQAYRAADVAVVPSTSLEGFGMVVPEAAACGTPSIVSDVGGLPEAVAELDRSLVVAAGDPSALAQRLLAAAGGALPSRERTRAFAEGFSWPRLAERHRALYRRLRAGERDGRMRVVYLDHVARLSGGEIALMRALRGMRGVNAHVILAEDGPLVASLQRDGVSVEVLAIAPAARDARRDTVRLGAASPLGAAQTLAYIARLTLRLRALEPDLVHTNSLKSGVYGSIAARAAGVPLVWHVRDRIAADYLPAAAVRLVRTLVRHLADGVVANSEATLATLPHRVRPAVSAVVPSPVELAADRDGGRDGEGAHHPPNQADGEGRLRFGLLGRIAPWKGQDLFLRAFASAFPAGGERARLIGAPMFGEEEFERELHALAAELGIAERVEFRGFREDVPSELASLDVLVHASVIPEPFGTVVLEGMAAGLPVIAADEGGPATLIDDGRSGCLFRSRDVRSLASAMRALAQDADQRARMGAAGREQADAYAPERIAARLEEVYARVLERDSTGVPERDWT